MFARTSSNNTISTSVLSTWGFEPRKHDTFSSFNACWPQRLSQVHIRNIRVPRLYTSLKWNCFIQSRRSTPCGPITLLAGSAQFPKAIGLLDVTNQVLTLHIVSAKKQKEIRNLLRKRPGPKKSKSGRSFNFHFTYFESVYFAFL